MDLAILLPTQFGVRNLVHSGVLARLTGAGVRTALLCLERPPELRGPFEGFADAAICEALEAPRRRGADRGRGLVNGVIANAVARRHDVVSHEIYRRWFQRHAGAAARLRARVVAALGGLARPEPVLRGLERFSERLYRRSHDLAPVRAQLERLRPKLLWSTTCTAEGEYPYYLAARDLGIPMLASILSFDNLTSRARLPVYDHYFVWNEAMKTELLGLYGEVPAERVAVTGTPQFDFHLLPEFRWNRRETLADLGLPEGSRYVLYAAGTEFLMPEEPELVRQFAERIRCDPDLSAMRLVVRLHPQDDASRWRALEGSGAGVTVSVACERSASAAGWRLPVPREQGRLIGSLLHADACVNVASTMSLDAAILGRPVICVEFSGEPESPRELVYAAYGASHYRPLVASGGVAVARRWAELLEMVRRARSAPEEGAAARAAMVQRVCGTVDGRSRDRVAAAVLALLGVTASAVRQRAGGA